MRMWGISPEFLCKNHLLGEHNEIHKHKHVFEKHYSIHNRIYPIPQICPKDMGKRHNQLVKEMLKRGYNHKSPYKLPDLSYLTEDERNPQLDIEFNTKDLKRRCKKCFINVCL